MTTGALGFMAISRQNSFGTSTGSWFYVPFVSESVVHNIDTLVEQGIKARIQEGLTIQGLQRGEGTIAMEPQPVEIGHFLRAAMGQSSSTLQSSVAAFNDFAHIFETRNADFDNSVPLPPYTLQIFRGVEEAFQFTDTVVSRLETVIEGGQFVRMNANVLTRTVSLMAKTTPAFVDISPWTWAVASVSLGGTAIEFVENLTVAIENSLEGVAVLNRKTFGKFRRTGFQQVLISGRMDLENLNQYDEFVANSETTLKLHLAPTVTSGPFLTIDIPAMRWTAIPVQVGGPFNVALDFTAKGYFKTTSNTAIRFTLVNTRANYQ